MHVEEKITKTYKLELTQKEKEWLSAVMQNPIQKPECDEERAMRKTFWDALEPPTAVEADDGTC